MDSHERDPQDAVRADGRIRLRPSTLLSPVPVVLVGCRGTGEDTSRPNLVAIAWTGTVCSDPPMVSVSIRKSRFSHGQILESREFTVNLVDAPLLRAADLCGVRSGRDVDKFALCGLTAAPSDRLGLAPTLSESPLTLECRVTEVKELGSHDLFLGEVVAVTARAGLLGRDGHLALDRADLVGYCHGDYWSLGRRLGFYGFSVAAPDVLRRRMKGR